MTKVTWLLAAGLAASLAGCDKSDQANENGANLDAATAQAAGWNAANACALVDKAAIAEAVGVGVTDARLGSTVSGEGLATHSTCSFALANNGTISVMTRKSPTPDFSPEAVEKSRTMGGAMPAAENVPGLGKAALWTKSMNNLQVFIDDSRYVTIQIVDPSKTRDPKAIATAIAAKLV